VSEWAELLVTSLAEVCGVSELAFSSCFIKWRMLRMRTRRSERKWEKNKESASVHAHHLKRN
jgi:hypothetical protein